MVKQGKLPVWAAILINVNIVIGSAFYMSVQKITMASGFLAPLSWLSCGMLLFPLIVVFATLAMRYPEAGGLYVYPQKCLGEFWGFISGWGYFIGTLAGNAAVIHAFSKAFQKIEGAKPALATYGMSGINFDIALVVLFTIFNLFNIEFLTRIQVALTLVKITPMCIALLSVPFLFKFENIISAPVAWPGFFRSLPIVLFSYIGIEACCAVIDKIENGRKSAARVIFISFAIIMAIYCLLQVVLLGIHGAVKINPFLELLGKMTTNQAIITWGNSLINVAMLASFLAGFYGMFYYNNWNLYAMAQEDTILFSDFLKRKTRNDVPWVCVLAQSLLIIFLLYFGRKSYYLITMSDFGVIIAYLLSTISFLTLHRTSYGLLALLSCGVVGYVCIDGLYNSGFVYVIPFVGVLAIGLVAHYVHCLLKRNSLNKGL
ncbi:MAG: APC family permease [Epsilonproteobacteria bacterium]|nr:APC family permease [Campylobacterota bacterium]